MNDFLKRVLAIKELHPSVTSNQGNVSYDNDLNVVATDETAIANKITEMDTARANEATTKANLKASAKAKLIAGEALTEDEANTIVL
jgi:hypothetical protein|tara:strand:+ start:2788 stop:3048 length:261 start_codon:yes stop_codon:yes gene_type:complete